MSIPVSELIKPEQEAEKPTSPASSVPKDSSTSSTWSFNYKELIYLLLAIMVALKLPYHNLDPRILTLGKDPLIAIVAIVVYYALLFFTV